MDAAPAATGAPGVARGNARRAGGRAARLFALLATLCAALLFAYAVRRAGTGEVVRGVARLGWWFAVVVVLAGVRLLVRAAEWRLCFEEPERVSLRLAWAGHVIGTGVGYLTPVGFAFGEGLKATTVRGQVGFGRALAAVAIANLFFTLSLLLFVAAGTGVLLAAYDVPAALRTICRVTIPVALAGAGCIAFVLARRGGATSYGEGAGGGSSGALGNLSRKLGSPAWAIGLAEQADAIGGSVGGFCARHPSRILPIASGEICFHLAGAAEVWVTLRAVEGAAPASSACVALEATSAVLNVVFGFVPLGIGVDEAGAGALASVLGVSTAAGVAVALVHKARTLLWAGVGVALLLLRRGRGAPRSSGEA